MRRSAVILLAVVAVLAAAPGAPASTAASRWTEVPHAHISGQDSYLFDAFASGGEVWSVGYRYIPIGGTSEFRTWTQRCVVATSTCTQSSTLDREGAPATNFLNGIGGSRNAPTDLWAVGWSRNPGQPSISLVEHWNGTSWSIVGSPNPSPFGNYLQAVSAHAPNDVWAVGEQTDSATATERPYVVHWDGNSWGNVPFTAVPGCTDRATLTDVDATGSAPLVSGTCRDAANAEQGFVAAWTIAGWTLEAGAGTVPAPSRMQGVTRVGSQVWAVGSQGAFPDPEALTMRKVGSTWAEVPTPPAGDDPQLFQVDGRRPGDVWAVGLTSIDSAFARRLSMHWNGTAWRVVPAGHYSRIEGLAIDGNGTPWGVGSDVGQSLILRGPS